MSKVKLTTTNGIATNFADELRKMLDAYNSHEYDWWATLAYHVLQGTGKYLNPKDRILLESMDHGCTPVGEPLNVFVINHLIRAFDNVYDNFKMHDAVSEPTLAKGWTVNDDPDMVVPDIWVSGAVYRVNETGKTVRADGILMNTFESFIPTHSFNSPIHFSVRRGDSQSEKWNNGLMKLRVTKDNKKIRYVKSDEFDVQYIKIGAYVMPKECKMTYCYTQEIIRELIYILYDSPAKFRYDELYIPTYKFLRK